MITRKQGGLITAVQHQTFWIAILTIAVLLSAVVTVRRAKASYTRFHHKINVLGYKIDKLLER